jgi:hypothetical protein
MQRETTEDGSMAEGDRGPFLQVETGENEV